VIAASAATSVIPTTLGTATGGGPVDIVSVTVSPVLAIAPAAGTWLMMLPLATVELDVLASVPTTRPTPVTALSAADSVVPTTLGTATGCKGKGNLPNTEHRL